ncbi:MAG: hypothetical protein Fur0032_18780 [Terrimicrobiaceae bacterium]
MLGETRAEHVPCSVIRADHKSYSRVVISEVIVETFESLDLSYPELDEKARADLEKSRRLLEAGQDHMLRS